MIGPTLSWEGLELIEKNNGKQFRLSGGSKTGKKTHLRWTDGWMTIEEPVNEVLRNQGSLKSFEWRSDIMKVIF